MEVRTVAKLNQAIHCLATGYPPGEGKPIFDSRRSPTATGTETPSAIASRQVPDAVAICVIPDSTIPHQAKVTSLTLAVKNQEPITIHSDLLADKTVQAVLNQFLSDDKIKVYANAKENLPALNQSGIRPGRRLFDIFLADSLLNAGLAQSTAISAIGQRYGVKNASSNEPHSLLALREVMKTELAAAGLVETAQIEFGAVPAIAAMESAGVRVDRHWLRQQQQEYQEIASNAAQVLHQALGNINLDAPQQVMQALQQAGVPLVGNSVACDALAPLAVDYPLVAEYLKYRTATDRAGKKGIAKYLAACDDEGIIYPTWNQNIAATGRMSADSPPIQGIPGELKAGLIPRPGYAIVKADYSQIELRILAQVSGDPTMRSVYQKGGDLHTKTAQFITGKQAEEITKEERKKAKPINFGEAYGQGAAGLVRFAKSAYGVNLTLAEARAYQAAISAGYPQLARWKQQITAEFKQQWEASVQKNLGNEPLQNRNLPSVRENLGNEPLQNRNLPSVRENLGNEPPHKRNLPTTRTLSGRTRKWLPLEGERPPVNEAINAPIQGSSADITKLALAQLPEALAGTGAFVVAARHDEIILEVPKVLAQVVGKRLVMVMEQAAARYLPDVPVTVELSIGDNWATEKLSPERLREREQNNHNFVRDRENVGGSQQGSICRDDAPVTALKHGGKRIQQLPSGIENNRNCQPKSAIEKPVARSPQSYHSPASELLPPLQPIDPDERGCIPFDIRNYVKFHNNRGACPCCVREGKSERSLDLALNPQTGEVWCWRGSLGGTIEQRHTIEEIRLALGLPETGLVPASIPMSAREHNARAANTPVLAKQTKSYTQQDVFNATDRLLEYPSPVQEAALQYLENRLITAEMARRYNIGLEMGFKTSDGREYPPSLVIFYEDVAQLGTFYKKRRYAPWMSEEELPPGTPKWGQYGMPDGGVVWVTHNPPNAQMTYLCEGPWDAIRLAEVVRGSGESIAIACCTTGAGGIPPLEQLLAIPGKEVVVFYDLFDSHDEGQKGAIKIHSALEETGKVAAIALLPHQPEHLCIKGYDVSNALDAGYTLSDFINCAQVALEREREKNNLALQQRRVEKVAPIVAAYLNSQRQHHVQGHQNTAVWDAPAQVLQLIPSGGVTPIVQAKYLAQQQKWIALEGTQLSVADVQHFERLAAMMQSQRKPKKNLAHNSEIIAS